MFGFDGAISMSPIDDDRLLVEERRPRRAVVGRLPDAARREADIDRGRVAFDDRDVVEPPAHDGRADRSPDEPLEKRIVRLVDGGWRRTAVPAPAAAAGPACPTAADQAAEPEPPPADALVASHAFSFYWGWGHVVLSCKSRAHCALWGNIRSAEIVRRRVDDDRGGLAGEVDFRALSARRPAPRSTGIP